MIDHAIQNDQFLRCELRECKPLISPVNGNMNCRRHPNAFPIPSLFDHTINSTLDKVRLLVLYTNFDPKREYLRYIVIDLKSSIQLIS